MHPSIPRVLVATAAIAGLAVLTGCDGTNPNVPRPGQPIVIDSGSPNHSANLAVAARDDRTAAEFELASGVTTLVLHSDDIGDDLYRISTPVGAGLRPAVVISGDHVSAQLVNSGVSGPSIVDITLNPDVAWTIHLDGGSTEATVDMHSGGLAALDFGAGVSRIEATLPVPKGTSTVTMSGGASTFTVHAPAGVPCQVTMSGGGGSARIDGDTHSGIGGGTVFTTNGYDSATNRIAVTNTAGVGTFVLDRWHPAA